MSEIWKTSCFSNEYSVSNMGRVKRNSTGKIYSNKISKGKNRLHLKGLKLDITVSREVLSAFHGKPDENQIVHYKDGNKLNDTCLLYTSPSPRDGLLSRMPSSA